MKKLSPDIKLKIINLSGCFWYWKSYYVFFSSILGISRNKLENKFPKDIFNKYQVTENILNELEEENNLEKIQEIISNFYTLKKPYDEKDNPKFKESIELLKEFKEVIGTDLVEDEIKKKDFKEKIEKRRIQDGLSLEKDNEISKIKDSFFKKCQETKLSAKQERGFWLEKVFYELLKLDNINNTPSYKTNNEQIDGHFKFGSFDYLVEIKWVEEPFKQKDVSIFNGKIENKAQSNRGFIFSVNGFDDSAIEASRNKRNLIFMDSKDFISILERRMDFSDLLKSKEDQLVRFGRSYKK